jgi:hypothetical protein
VDAITSISLPACTGVIFPASTVPRHLDPDGEAWMPTVEQVADAERRLPAYLAGANPRLPSTCDPDTPPRIAARLDQYARQYFGIVSEGRRVLFINCLPVDSRSDWRVRPVFVCDGGDAYFQLLYDPELMAFTSMSVNGEA